MWCWRGASPHPDPEGEEGGLKETAQLAFPAAAVKYNRGDRMEDLSLKDRIASLQERLNVFGRHL